MVRAKLVRLESAWSAKVHNARRALPPDGRSSSGESSMTGSGTPGKSGRSPDMRTSHWNGRRFTHIGNRSARQGAHVGTSVSHTSPRCESTLYGLAEQKT